MATTRKKTKKKAVASSKKTLPKIEIVQRTSRRRINLGEYFENIRRIYIQDVEETNAILNLPQLNKSQIESKYAPFLKAVQSRVESK